MPMDKAKPRFSQSSLEQLATCHPDLQTLFKEVIKHFDCVVMEGYRGQEAQDKAYASGNSKLKYPNGKHNRLPSHAVDVSPYPIDWKKPNRMYWFAGFVMGIAQMLKDQGKITHEICYGGDWDSDKDITDQTFMDLVHFQLKE